MLDLLLISGDQKENDLRSLDRHSKEDRHDPKTDAVCPVIHSPFSFFNRANICVCLISLFKFPFLNLIKNKTIVGPLIKKRIWGQHVIIFY